MPRPLRIEYTGAWYHVMNRGINRMEIFLNDEQRKIFLDLLAEITLLFKIKIHSYCLMDNHYHLLIETPHANLSKAMRHLNCLYTQRFNRMEKRDGALFRGRYKAILIENEGYLLKVSRYIHLNPLEANMVKELDLYKWSSYTYYIKSARPEWLCTSYILSFFGKEDNYTSFISEGVDSELDKFYNSPQMPSILGCAKFKSEKLNTLEDNYKVETSPDINRVNKFFTIDKISAVVAMYFNIEIGSLKKRFRNNFPRMLAIFLSRHLTQFSHQKIAEYFCDLKKSSVSKTVIKCRNLMYNNPNFQKDYFNIMQSLYES